VGPKYLAKRQTNAMSQPAHLANAASRSNHNGALAASAIQLPLPIVSVARNRGLADPWKATTKPVRRSTSDSDDGGTHSSCAASRFGRISWTPHSQ